MKVYLAGTINTLDDYFQRWREDVAQVLRNHGIVPLCPLAGKPMFENGTFSKDGGITSTVPSRSILMRDYMMVRSANLILANLKVYGDKGKCEKPFVGTFYELAWAWEFKKPVIAIIESDNYLFNNHPFIAESITHKFETEEAAVRNIVEYWNWENPKCD